MTYNTYGQQPHGPDHHRMADAMRRFFQNRSGGDYGGGDGYDNRYNGGGQYYNGIPGYNPANPYEEPGRYDQRPNASMGFDPYQNQQLPQHEYGRPNREYQREDHEFDKRMDDYFRRISEGRTDVPESLCEVVASGVHMYMGNSGTGSHGDTHMQYKKAIERIREANSMQEKEKLMKEYFGDDLTEDERVVLRDMSTMKSYKQKAREKWGNNAGMERWMEAKKSLKHKLKNIA